ncbi:MAG: hypothetical protein RLZZ524_935 [Pseudomonadota bacterium]|jgi:hypothetical protein
MSIEPIAVVLAILGLVFLAAPIVIGIIRRSPLLGPITAAAMCSLMAAVSTIGSAGQRDGTPVLLWSVAFILSFWPISRPPRAQDDDAEEPPPTRATPNFRMPGHAHRR